MNRLPLSDAEQALLRRYQQLAATPSRLGYRLVSEIVPPAAMVGLWVWSGKVVFLLLTVVLLVGFNVWRVWQQRHALLQLRTIADKSLEA